MNEQGEAMEEEGTIKRLAGPGLNSCIWCQSSYANASVTHSKGSRNDLNRMQSYRRKRYKLLLGYLLQQDTVHSPSEQENENKHRRHLLIQKLLELSETEENTGSLYQLCPNCEGKADQVMKFHLELEVVQMKLVQKLSCLTNAIISNSIYGSNEGTKKRMQALETWLQQEEDKVDTGIMAEVERLKDYVDTLLQFQTLIFEGGRRPTVIPCVFLQKLMPNSLQFKLDPLSGIHENEKLSDADWSGVEDASEYENSDADPASDSESDISNLSSSIITPGNEKILDVSQVEKTQEHEISPTNQRSNGDGLPDPPSSINPETGSPHPLKRDKLLHIKRKRKPSTTIQQNKKFKCNICNKMCDTKNRLKRHQQLHQRDPSKEPPLIIPNPETGRYHCPLCPKDFKTSFGFRLHYKATHLKLSVDSKTGHDCSQCGKWFSRKSYLTTHHQVFHLGVKFECHVCKKSFSQKPRLNFHHRTTSCGTALGLECSGAPPKSICDLCGKEFTRMTSLRAHLKLVHEANQHRGFKCEHCDKSFGRQNDLFTHTQSVHLGIRSECQVCEKSFSQKRLLDSHYRWTACGAALGMKPAPKQNCELCGKEFGCRDSLKKHVKKDHKDRLAERKYPCQVCGKMFKTKHYVKIHQKGAHQDVKRNKKPKKILDSSLNDNNLCI